MGARSGARLAEPRYSQSLETGLLIMRGFTSERPVQGIADVADRMEASRSTIHRYMTTLVALGMLEQEPHSRRYKVGKVPADLGKAVLEVDRVVAAVGGASLQRLRRGTGCTVRLGVMDGPEVVIAASQRSWEKGQGLLGVQLRRGARVPCHCTALGKVLLSMMEARALREWLASAALRRHTPRTVVNKRTLTALAAEVAAEGVAEEDQEHERGVVGLAVQVRDSAGAPAAALGLLAHTPEITLEQIRGHRPALQAAAAEIGKRIEPAQPLRVAGRRRD